MFDTKLTPTSLGTPTPMQGVRARKRRTAALPARVGWPGTWAMLGLLTLGALLPATTRPASAGPIVSWDEGRPVGAADRDEIGRADAHARAATEGLAAVIRGGPLRRDGLVGDEACRRHRRFDGDYAT